MASKTKAALSEEDKKKQENLEANTCLGAGAGVATLSALIGGPICPLCYVVVPGLLGVGAYKKWSCRRAEKLEPDQASAPGENENIEKSQEKNKQ